MNIRRSLASIGTAIVAVVGFSVIPASANTTAGTEHILLLQTSVNAVPTIIATGPIHAAGRDVFLPNDRDHFIFPAGTLFIAHHVQKQHDTSDPTTCLFRHFETGTYNIVRGTGAYANAAGHGTYHLKVLAVGCDQTKPPSVFVLQINASGPLTL